MSPDDDGFARRAAQIRERVAQQGFMALVGATLDELAPGRCTIWVGRRPELLQQYGMFHCGVTAFLVDNGTTIAAATAVAPGQATLTAEYKINLLSPATGARLVCCCRVIKPGRMLTVLAADVVSVADDGTETHTATALATIAGVDAARLRPPG